MTAPPTTTLYEYDKLECRDLMRRLRPDMDDAEFDRLWAEFADWKYERGRRLQQN